MSVRWLVPALVALGCLLLLASLPIALASHRFAQKASTAPAIVKSLLAGPLHAEVDVKPSDGRAFTYIENQSRQPLQIGQRLMVRFDPAQPEASAQATIVGVYHSAIEVALTGLIMILMALVSPLLVRAFPRLLAFPVRD